ncbi:chemotaxis protein CheB [Azospirillum canadense]|uniref:chemotaxis protein CheB n=1 Tax=Azospirillum canadense TaxID=403962 RepID=UPI0022273A1B|nr:chemotaxis protein CheB [Azospirillum canadense]MCW2239996.1 two-component system chemotaxis response regulator CheB [Azospirillum canadense]
METRNILALGASAGGVTALQRLFSAMPADTTATVFVVQHIAPTRNSVLPRLLEKAGWLPAFHPQDGEEVREGWIHVAPPDHHLLVRDGRLLVRRGAKENRTRPAIDPLFRSLAVEYGPRVIGAILSGTLDDGAAGLLAVKRRGGIAIVQDPTSAEWPDMPRNAREHVAVDHCVTLEEMAPLLTRLLGTPAPPAPAVPEEMAVEAQIPEKEFNTVPADSDRIGTPSVFSCPDCGGNLYEVEDGSLLRYRCKVGHAYSPQALASANHDLLERALWVALRAHEDRMILFKRMAEKARKGGHDLVAERWSVAAAEVQRSITLLRDVLSSPNAVLDDAPLPPAGESLLPE